MITIIYYVIEIAPSLASGNPFRLGCTLLTVSIFLFFLFEYFVIVTRYCRFILYFFSSSPRSPTFSTPISKEP